MLKKWIDGDRILSNEPSSSGASNVHFQPVKNLLTGEF
jgi:hypothetical protein